MQRWNGTNRDGWLNFVEIIKLMKIVAVNVVKVSIGGFNWREMGEKKLQLIYYANDTFLNGVILHYADSDETPQKDVISHIYK